MKAEKRKEEKPLIRGVERGKEPDWERIVGMQRLGDANVNVMGWEQPVNAAPPWHSFQPQEGAYTLTTSSASPSISYTASSLVSGPTGGGLLMQK